MCVYRGIVHDVTSDWLISLEVNILHMLIWDSPTRPDFLYMKNSFVAHVNI